MSADMWAVILVVTAAPPATLFPICYGLTAKWWKYFVGWALMISSIGLGLLIDISLAYKWFGDEYLLRDAVRLTVYALISAGCWLTFLAWLVTRRRGRSER